MNLDSIQSVMNATSRVQEGAKEYLVLPAGAMYDKKVFKGEVTGRKHCAQLMEEWFNIVRSTYEQQEEQAVAASSKAKAHRADNKQKDTSPGDGGGSTEAVPEAVPDVETDIATIIRGRLVIAREKYEGYIAQIQAVEKLASEQHTQIQKLELLEEAL